MNYYKCNKCGWIHFAMSGIESTYTYDITKCFKCKNSYKDFSPSDPPPVGSTVQPILVEKDFWQGPSDNILNIPIKMK